MNSFLFNEHNGTISTVVCIITLFTLSLFFLASSISLSLLVIVLSYHFHFHHPLPWYLLHSFHLCLHIIPVFLRCPLLSCSKLDIQEQDKTSNVVFVFVFLHQLQFCTSCTKCKLISNIIKLPSSTHLLFQ